MRSSKLHLSSQLEHSNKQSYRKISSPTSHLILSKGRTPKALAQSQRINSQETRTRRNSKSIHRSQEKDESIKSKKKLGGELDEIYKELVNLKGEYKSLKESYNVMIKEKMEVKKREGKYQEEIARLVGENTQMQKKIDRYKSQIDFYDHEIERIKRESMKLLEIENFKMQKLEENLVEKESMIFYLKNREHSEFKDILACSAPMSNILNCTNPFNSKSSLIQSPKDTLNYHDLHESSLEQNQSKYSSYETRKQRNQNGSLIEDEKETRRKDCDSDSDDEEVDLLYNRSQNCNFKKKKDLQTLLNCKSPMEKKKRSVTGNKMATAVKKKEGFKGVKTKKLPNQTVR